MPKHAYEPSAAILARLEDLHPEIIDLSLERVNRLLQTLGNPQNKLNGVVHVAGTNGKGSTIAFLKSIFEAAGKRVHVFTSPHLVHFHERIALAGSDGAENITEERLSDALARVEQANEGAPITFFEITTAAAFLAFSEVPADYVLLETGLGGRLDATNVVDKPALTIITPVSYDHDRYLGSDLAGIAFEKAGILKQGVPCVLTRQPNISLDVIENRAHELDVPLIPQGQAWDAFEQQGHLIFQTDTSLLDLPLPRLPGRHQIDNAGVALAGVRALTGEAISSTALAEGLTSAHWPARLQKLDSPVFEHLLAQGTEIWLDGGHNAAAAQALANAIAEMEERVPKPLHLICGMMAGKDARSFFSHFKGLAEWAATIPIPGKENALDAEQLAAIAEEAGMAAQHEPDLTHALEASRIRAGEPVRILICGSLYLAGHVLETIEKSPG